MRLIPTKLDGVVIIEPDVFVDHRGFFMESYSEKKIFRTWTPFSIRTG